MIVNTPEWFYLICEIDLGQLYCLLLPKSPYFESMSLYRSVPHTVLQLDVFTEKIVFI